VADLEATVAALAARVSQLEDRLAIYQLMTTYGPAVDAGAGEVAAALWTADGVYDAGMGADAIFVGAEAVGSMVEGEMHQGIIAGGSAHLIGLPHLEVHGDRAVATCYSQLMLYDGDRASFRVWRATANRWELVRTAQGWKVTSRVNRVLDGDPEARALLRAGIDPGADPSLRQGTEGVPGAGQ
jgi:hypothetical protein